MIEYLYQEENKKQKENIYIYIYGGEFGCGTFMVAVVWERERDGTRESTDIVWFDLEWIFLYQDILVFFFPDKSMLIEDLKGNFLKDWYAKYYVFINFVKWWWNYIDVLLSIKQQDMTDFIW